MVLCSGCFDGLHVGHVAYLQAAAQLLRDGERLIVAVADDAYVQRIKQREPRWTLVDRMMAVKALRVVDEVIRHDADGAASVIRRIEPRLFVKGDDWMVCGLQTDVVDACAGVTCLIVYVHHDFHRHTSDES